VPSALACKSQRQVWSQQPATSTVRSTPGGAAAVRTMVLNNVVATMNKDETVRLLCM
jgi:hypothetical protein